MQETEYEDIYNDSFEDDDWETQMYDDIAEREHQEASKDWADDVFDEDDDDEWIVDKEIDMVEEDDDIDFDEEDDDIWGDE
jgi:hypothetical protein